MSKRRQFMNWWRRFLPMFLSLLGVLWSFLAVWFGYVVWTEGGASAYSAENVARFLNIALDVVWSSLIVAGLISLSADSASGQGPTL